MMNWRRVRKQLSARLPKSSVVIPEFSGFCLSAAAFLGFYCLFFPRHAGVAGAMLVRTLTRSFGQGSYLLWLMVGYRGLRLLFRREKRRPWRYVLVDLLLLTATCGFLSTFGAIFLDINPGGYVGKSIAQFLTPLIGRWGALFVTVFTGVGFFLWRSGKRPMDLINWIWN